MTDRAIEYLNIIRDEPYLLGKWSGFESLEQIHNQWIKRFLFCNVDQTLLAHRGSYKTTCLSIAIAILLITYPNKTILFLRKTDTDIIEIIKQVAKLLQNDVFQEITKEIYGNPIQLFKETGSEIDTNLNTFSRGTSQLLGLGIKSSITGKHADIVITDDIVNLKDRISKAERELTKAAYMELQNVKNRGGRFINTGTTWHKEDAISTMPNQKVYTCHDTGLMTKEDIEHLRNTMTPSLFAANYELKHIADADAMFTAPKFTEQSIHNGIAHIDASYGGSDGTAFTVLKALNDGTFVVLGKRWDKHVDDCIDEIKQLYEYYRVGTVYCEDNADKGYLKKELQKQGFIASGYHESMNKYIKISSYLRKHWVGIFFLHETDEKYLNEILDYTENAEHDDSPDSLASLVRKVIGSNNEFNTNVEIRF